VNLANTTLPVFNQIYGKINMFVGHHDGFSLLPTDSVTQHQWVVSILQYDPANMKRRSHREPDR